MSIEIRNLTIKSSVIQRQRDDGRDAPPDDQAQDPSGGQIDEALRAECRRMITELLDARTER